jgi:CRISPR-associated protein Csm4
MKNLTVYLEPKSVVKKGGIRSDTLFGALIWGIRLLFEGRGLSSVTELLKRFKKDSKKPPFLISSTFAYVKADGDRLIHLFPLPILEPIQPNFADWEKYKEFSRVSFVSDKVLEKIIKGEHCYTEIYKQFTWLVKADDSYMKVNPDARFVKIGKALFDADEADLLIQRTDTGVLKEYELQRNAIDRLSGGTIEGKLFYDSLISFKSGSGLYFVLKVEDEFEVYIKSALKFLADKGIGGDSTIGHGAFEILEIRDGLPLTEPVNGSHFITLSLYYPTNEEAENYNTKSGDVWYDLIRRRGKIESSFITGQDVRKQMVLMFAEGSTFPDSGKSFYGENPIVRKQPFEVQHYGYAFPIRMVVKK